MPRVAAIASVRSTAAVACSEVGTAPSIDVECVAVHRGAVGVLTLDEDQADGRRSHRQAEHRVHMNPFGPTSDDPPRGSANTRTHQRAPSRRGRDPPFALTLPGDSPPGSPGPRQPAVTTQAKVAGWPS